MKRLLILLLGGAFAAVGLCTLTHGRHGPTATGRAKLYRIGSGDTARIQFRMLDSVNALRQAAGVPPVELERATERRRRDPFARHVGAEPALAFRL